MNGREIVNAIHTARTIARFETKPLMLGHIETVLGVWREFDESLKKTAKLTAQTEEKTGRLSIVRRSSIIEEESDGFKS
ncbi:hypothetical protein N7456_003659 [Penicillium angulare]|uniref:Uncharacterized protein n=1 Tax=Penicillium angulare TaxID=116970 RepID=A0A9W9FV69_9EURO|nr:hypothetical protein N7456_003659 [Penicillium angulare]